jgi:hypothetical protein
MGFKKGCACDLARESIKEVRKQERKKARVIDKRFFL